MVTETHWPMLCDAYESVRRAFRVASRALTYKNLSSWRKLWPEAIEPWLDVQRKVPALALCVAYDKRMRDSPRYRQFLQRNRETIAVNARSPTMKATEDAMCKLSPFLILGGMLPRGAITWYSDPDRLLTGFGVDEAMVVASKYLELGGADVSLLVPKVADPSDLPLSVEQALSLPDLVCGTITDVAPLANTPIKADALKPDAFRVANYLCAMGGALGDGGSNCKFHLSIIDFVPDIPDGWRHSSAIFGVGDATNGAD